MATKKRVLVLISTCNSSTDQEKQQRRVVDLLNAKNVAVDFIDGGLPENKEKRDELFELSNARKSGGPLYPQVFIVEGDNYEFVGNGPQINELIESDAIPEDLLKQNPDIKTFSRVFADVSKARI